MAGDRDNFISLPYEYLSLTTAIISRNLREFSGGSGAAHDRLVLGMGTSLPLNVCGAFPDQWWLNYWNYTQKSGRVTSSNTGKG